MPTPPRWRRSSTPRQGSSRRIRSPTRSDAIAHHLGELLDFDEIYALRGRPRRRDARPVFALGAYADEVMADAFPIGEGVTGWVVANRRTRNVERADHDPIVAVVEGTELEPESLVSVPLIVGDRVVAALNVYRIGVGSAFTDGRGRARSSASRRWPRSPSTPRASATRCASRRAPTASPGCSTTAPATSGCGRRSRARRRRTGRSSVVVRRPRPLQADQRRLRPRRGRQGARRGRRPAALDRCARTTSSPGSAARSSR